MFPRDRRYTAFEVHTKSLKNMLLSLVLDYNPFHDLGTLFWAIILLVSAVTWIFRELRERAGQSWPIANGTVESAELTVVDGRMRAEVRYSYSVDGEYYSGLFFRIPSTEKRGEKILLQFPKGSRVFVHVKPSDPEISVLDREEIKAKFQFPVQIG